MNKCALSSDVGGVVAVLLLMLTSVINCTVGLVQICFEFALRHHMYRTSSVVLVRPHCQELCWSRRHVAIARPDLLWLIQEDGLVSRVRTASYYL